MSAISSPMRFAYADPPYPGMARRWYRDHPDYGGEVDHGELVERLVAEFPDGWALSTSAKALREVVALCPPEIRVCAWVKPMAAVFTRSLSVQWCWEPVLLFGGRDRRGRAPIVRDWVASSSDAYRWRESRHPDHVTGAKPDEFCSWLFDLLGAEPGDELTDLFPGSGAVGRAWQRWLDQPRLPLWEQEELAL